MTSNVQQLRAALGTDLLRNTEKPVILRTFYPQYFDPLHARIHPAYFHRLFWGR